VCIDVLHEDFCQADVLSRRGFVCAPKNVPLVYNMSILSFFQVKVLLS
jgi:hypothetical protein